MLLLSLPPRLTFTRKLVGARRCSDSDANHRAHGEEARNIEAYAVAKVIVWHGQVHTRPIVCGKHDVGMVVFDVVDMLSCLTQ